MILISDNSESPLGSYSIPSRVSYKGQLSPLTLRSGLPSGSHHQVPRPLCVSHTASLCSLHLACGPSHLGQLSFSPPLPQGPALLLRLRSRSWCVRAGLAPAISRAVASCRNTWAEGARRGSSQAPAPSRHLTYIPNASQSPMGTHPPHGRPETLCQTPQTTQVPLEATELEGRGLGPTARAR